MTPLVRPDRCCPECKSRDYVFRGRRTVEDDEGKVVVTKYHCRPCSHEWKERVPVEERKAG